MLDQNPDDLTHRQRVKGFFLYLALILVFLAIAGIAGAMDLKRAYPH